MEEPVGTIRRKRPKDRDARKESNRGEGKKREREEGGRRGEERRDEKRKNVEKSDGLSAQNVVQRHCR